MRKNVLYKGSIILSCSCCFNALSTDCLGEFRVMKVFLREISSTYQNDHIIIEQFTIFTNIAQIKFGYSLTLMCSKALFPCTTSISLENCSTC